MRKTIVMAYMLGAAMLCVTCITGCEDRRQDSDIAIDPQSSTLSKGGDTVVLTVTDPNGVLVRPLQWSVTNPALGAIMRAAGDSAIYQRGAADGSNGVVVRDDTGREGIAEIIQI
jgi:hypothetical protein